MAAASTEDAHPEDDHAGGEHAEDARAGTGEPGSAPVAARHLDSGNIARARSSTVTRPVVRSAAAAGKLATSLRRLGADDGTVDRLTGRRGLLR